MGRRRRQSKSKEVVGGGPGVDSSADKGAGRERVHFEGFEGSDGKCLNLKQAFVVLTSVACHMLRHHHH